jgi:hypothetical protein
MILKHDVRSVSRQFLIPGEFVGAEPYGSGHINDTYRVVFAQGPSQVRYIFQRINHAIFKHPVALMENIQRVTEHLALQAPRSDRSALKLIPTGGGHCFYCDPQGNHWRVYNFIENARTFDAVESAAQAFQAGQAFGQFQRQLANLPLPRLHDTIPDFHHTPKRFAALEKAVARDSCNRAFSAKPEIEFALRHKAMVSILLDAGLPERVTHNDTKLSNVLLDDATGEGICVVDLDTVMPGLALYDFGDMVRTATSPTAEDERDLEKVGMRFPMFEALARGYIAATAEFLTPAEKQLLPFSGKLITFEIGIRFLADFLEGDTYYKTHRAGQNLDRCRTQFKLMESIASQEAAMNRLVESI